MSKPAGGDEEPVWSKSSARFVRYAMVFLLRTNDEDSLTPFSKRNSEYFDPCQEAADRSLKCLRRNGGERAMCQDYFEYV